MTLETASGKITIPGRPERVDSSRFIGGFTRGIELEVTEKQLTGDLSEAPISAALVRGERVFKVRGDGYAYLLPESSVESTGETVLIPGKPVEVDKTQVEGDYRSGIRFEVHSEEDYPSDLVRSAHVKETMEAGGRVFVTENDDLLFVKPPIE